MGSQKSSESTSYSGSAQKWATPFAKDAVRSVTNTYNQYAPYTSRALDATEGLGQNLAAKYDAGSAQAASARGYYGDVLSGKYLGGNPYTSGMIDQMREGVTDQVNSQFSLGGRYGSGAHTGALAKELAGAENQLRYNDFNAQMARMDNAAAGALGSNTADAQTALGAQGQIMTGPYAGMSAYAGALGNLFSGGTQKSVTYSPNPIWGAAGAALGAAGARFSDERLKRDIVIESIRGDGLPVKSWIYNNDPEQRRYEGHVAQDVAKIYPEAVIENYNGTGYLGVNYALIPQDEKVAA